MNRLDYMAQVEGLHASPELRARLDALAREPRPRRRFKPWMGVCAALAVVVIGVGVFSGAIPLPRFGGSAGGGGHDEGSTFMSYAGPVFPLTLGEENDNITAERDVTLDFASWEPVWVEAPEMDAGGYWSRSTDILVTDSYTLTNHSDTDQSITIYYPFVSSVQQLWEESPTLTVDGQALETSLRAGDYSGGFQGAWGEEFQATGENPGTANLLYPESWEDYRALLADGSYLEGALTQLPDLSHVPAIVYRFTDAWGGPEDEEHPNPTLRVLFSLDYAKTAVLSTGFHAGMYDRENGIMGKGFSIPQPGDLRPTEEWCLIVVGEDISDITTQGYVTGGWDTEETMEAGATMDRYETNLATALRTHYLDQAWERLEKAPGMTYELYCGLAFDFYLTYGSLSDHPMERYDDSMLNTEFALVDRVFYLTGELTIPAGGSVTLTANMTKEASYDHYCAHTENQGVYGYDLVTQLGSNLTCTSQTATLEDRGFIEIVRQNFGFDLDNGVNTVTLDPAQEHYYMEVRRTADE